MSSTAVVAARLPNETIQQLKDEAEAAGLTLGELARAILEAHLTGQTPAPVAEQPAPRPSKGRDSASPFDLYPEKAKPGAQLWHPGGLIAEFRDLANKRGVDFASILGGAVELERQLRPSVARPIMSVPKDPAQPPRPRAR